jgi:hypothetical protein
MSCRNFQNLIASTLIVALVAATAPVFAAPATASLTGTVYGTDVATPLPGATVVVTDVNGLKTSSQPTGTDGVFTIAAVTPGRTELSLETTQGTFAVATPVILAPGQTKDVQLALKASTGKADNETNKKKKGGGAYWTGGEITALTVVLVGAAAATWLAIDRANEDVAPPASPYTPPSD